MTTAVGGVPRKVLRNTGLLRKGNGPTLARYSVEVFTVVSLSVLGCNSTAAVLEGDLACTSSSRMK